MTLQDLIGKNVQVCISASRMGGFIRGRLSQDNCTGGDYAVHGDQSLFIFHESTLSHINSCKPEPVLVFVKG